MARRHYWQFLVTDEGNPIENAEITVYLAGTETTAYVYSDELGGVAVNTDPQVNTSRKGYFEFWIADENELNGYPYTQKFKIAWNAAGISAGYIDYIDVFSTSVEPVLETDIDETRNKAVSNLLANGWETHKDSELYVSGVTEIHGMSGVNTDQYTSVDSNTRKNKLVNNVLAHFWEAHTTTVYDATDNRWEYNGGDAAVGAGAGLPGKPHGIDFVDVNDTDTETNRLVSNSLANQWHEHRTNASLDEHTQYSNIDGTRAYTAPVGYSDGTVVSGAGNNDFITKAYLSTLTGQFSLQVNPGDWSAEPSGGYSYVVSHGLGINYPIVMTWDVGSATKEMIFVDRIVHVDSSSVKLYCVTNYTLFVRVTS